MRIDPAPVEAKPYAVSPLRWSVREQKRAYNEMIEFWGSLVEVINYKVTGQLPQYGQAESGIIKYLRDSLLLEIR